MCARRESDRTTGSGSRGVRDELAANDPRQKVHISPDPTVTDDELADVTSPADLEVPPEPYPAGAAMRTLCRRIVLWSLRSFAFLVVPLLAVGAAINGATGVFGALFGELTVILFCLPTPVAMYLLARNRLNSKGRMSGYLKAMVVSIAVKVLLFAGVWILVMDDPRFSRPLFLAAALVCAVDYLVVVAIVTHRQIHENERLRQSFVAQGHDAGQKADEPHFPHDCADVRH